MHFVQVVVSFDNFEKDLLTISVSVSRFKNYLDIAVRYFVIKVSSLRLDSGNAPFQLTSRELPVELDEGESYQMFSR